MVASFTNNENENMGSNICGKNEESVFFNELNSSCVPVLQSLEFCSIMSTDEYYEKIDNEM